MKKLNKKNTIIIIVSAILVVGLIITAVLLIANLTGEKKFNATIVDVEEKKSLVKANIIDWDSSTKTHDKTPTNPDAKCAIFINGGKYEYEDFNTAWIAACTTYKNIGSLEFVLFADWIATNGSFGSDSALMFYGSTGSIVVNDWTSDVTFDLNGYKIDRNISSKVVNGGEVIYLYNSNNITIKNGCITGGGNDYNGGGIWAGGDDINCTIENMVITGNVAGANGGGIYTNEDVESLNLNNTTVTGNYSEGQGGGVYCDYSTSFIGNCVLNLYNVVKIYGNDGNDDKDNLTLYACGNDENAKTLEVALTSGSNIYVTFTRYDDVTRTIDGNYNYDHDNDQYFHVENDNWELRVISKAWGGFQHPMLCLRKKASC